MKRHISVFVSICIVSLLLAACCPAESFWPRAYDAALSRSFTEVCGTDTFSTVIGLHGILPSKEHDRVLAILSGNTYRGLTKEEDDEFQRKTVRFSGVTLGTVTLPDGGDNINDNFAQIELYKGNIYVFPTLATIDGKQYIPYVSNESVGYDELESLLTTNPFAPMLNIHIVGIASTILSGPIPALL